MASQMSKAFPYLLHLFQLGEMISAVTLYEVPHPSQYRQTATSISWLHPCGFCRGNICTSTLMMSLESLKAGFRDPQTGKEVEAGSVTAATWHWYSLMDAALQGQHSISPPLVVAANLTATTGGTVSTPASAPSAEEARVSQGQRRKRPWESEALLEFMKEQAEREEEREREALARGEGKGSVRKSRDT
eukprot:superscaffoldBa00008001_g23004